MYSGVLDSSKILSLIRIYFLEIEILSFGDQNRKTSKIRDSHFVFLAFTDYFQPAHSRSLQTFASFLPKFAEDNVTKAPFSLKIYERIFLEF